MIKSEANIITVLRCPHKYKYVYVWWWWWCAGVRVFAAKYELVRRKGAMASAELNKYDMMQHFLRRYPWSGRMCVPVCKR